MRAEELRWQFCNVAGVEVITAEVVQRFIVYIMHSRVAMFYMDGQQYTSCLQGPRFKSHLQPAGVFVHNALTCCNVLYGWAAIDKLSARSWVQVPPTTSGVFSLL